MDVETPTRKRPSWPPNVIFLGLGMVIGGAPDISGPGGAVLIVGFVAALLGLGDRIFTSD